MAPGPSWKDTPSFFSEDKKLLSGPDASPLGSAYAGDASPTATARVASPIRVLMLHLSLGRISGPVAITRRIGVKLLAAGELSAAHWCRGTCLLSSAVRAISGATAIGREAPARRAAVVVPIRRSAAIRTVGAPTRHRCPPQSAGAGTSRGPSTSAEVPPARPQSRSTATVLPSLISSVDAFPSDAIGPNP